MAETSHIEWTDATWNPITGCSVVSPGCTNCYAMKLAGTRLKHHPSRAGLTRDTKAGPVWNGKVRLNVDWCDQPLRWNRPRMIFVCAHGDLFHEDVPDAWIDQVFAVMAGAPQHTFQVLTKRAGRMREYLTSLPARIYAQHGSWERFGDHHLEGIGHGTGRLWPLPNVWLGISAEDQARANERIPDLLAAPAAIRFASAEPLLGPISITEAMWSGREDPADLLDASLDWIIVGGESGSDARPTHPDWVRSLRDQCAASGTAFFFKQWGSWAAVSQMTEDLVESCYPPRSDRYPEATRRPRVATHVLHVDGSRHDNLAWRAFEQGKGAMTMFEVGKRRAGRLLDGIEHNGMPQPREVPAL